jgi:hypothetical protein
MSGAIAGAFHAKVIARQNMPLASRLRAMISHRCRADEWVASMECAWRHAGR